MSLLEKVLDKLDSGMRLVAVGHHTNVNKLTIQFTKKNKDMNRGSIKDSALSGAKISCVFHHDLFV